MRGSEPRAPSRPLPIEAAFPSGPHRVPRNAPDLHAHHLIPWWRGGRTDVDNLVLICSFHHKLIHEHGYRIRRHDDRWQVLRPDGTEIPGAVPSPAGDLDDLIETATRAGQLITPASVTPTWFGERLDPEPILDTLLPRHRPAAAA